MIPSMKLQRLEFLDVIGLLGGTHFQVVEGLLASSFQKNPRNEAQQDDCTDITSGGKQSRWMIKTGISVMHKEIIYYRLAEQMADLFSTLTVPEFGKRNPKVPAKWRDQGSLSTFGQGWVSPSLSSRLVLHREHVMVVSRRERPTCAGGRGHSRSCYDDFAKEKGLKLNQSKISRIKDLRISTRLRNQTRLEKTGLTKERR